MKKHVIITVLMFTMILIASCATAASSTKITEHQPYTARGEDDLVFVGDVLDLSFVSEETALPSSFPIYVDKYPFGQEGPLFLIDQPLIDLATENLKRFLQILYDDDDVSQYTIEPHAMLPERVVYDTGLTEISSDPSAIKMLTGEYGMADVMASGNLLENTLIQAALAYLHIDNPKIVPVIQYTESGEIYQYQYTIYDNSGDFFENILNSSFSFVRATHYPDTSDVLLTLRKTDISDLYSNELVIPYEEALDYIQDTYGVTEKSNIHAEVYYSNSVEEGYFIPCYKFFIEDSSAPTPNTTENVIVYNVVHIPMLLNLD